MDMKKENDAEKAGVTIETQSAHTLESMALKEGIRPAFLAKVRVLNEAISECGMGAYQYKLFFSAGFGWFADNIWLQSIAILTPAIANENAFPSYPYIRMATFSLYIGLIVGATFWGMTCDVIGRRLAWNATLIIGGIFGVAAGASDNFVTLGAMLACIGFGVGGNLPVDGALFLEFLPGSHQYLLTFLSVWWAIGQVVGSLISWVFLAKYSCDPNLVGTPGFVCDASNNSGWRYACETFYDYTLGALMLFLSAVRVFALPMDESPKFLASIGRDEEAVQVIHNIAKANGVTSTLTVEQLRQAAAPFLTEHDKVDVTTKFSTLELIKHSFDDISFEHVTGLFSTPRLAWSTSLIIFCYGALGLAYPLFNGFLGSYLAAKNASTGDNSIDATYSAYTYQAACGVIGSIFAAFMVQWSRGGRKFAMAFSTILSGVFLFGLTAARTGPQINALTCMASLFENMFYGVLYGYAPELFPTPHRGTGDAFCAAASRVTGLFAPVIAVYSQAAKTPNGPVYASAAIFVFTGLTMFGLPIETAGVTAL